MRVRDHSHGIKNERVVSKSSSHGSRGEREGVSDPSHGIRTERVGSESSSHGNIGERGGRINPAPVFRPNVFWALISTRRF